MLKLYFSSVKAIAPSLFLLICFQLNSSFAQDCDFKEAGGLLIMEMESSNIPSDWKVNTKGDQSFIEWIGKDQFGNPGTGIISYKLKFATTGIYRVQWRNKINEGTVKDQHNDSWMIMPNDQNLVFFGHKGASATIETDLLAKNENIVFPRDTGLGNEALGSKFGWFKLYLNVLDWSWSTNVNDEDSYFLYIKVNTPGTYELQVSARATYHALDKMVFYHLPTFGDDLPNAQLEGFTESANNCPVATPATNNSDGKCEFEEVNGIALMEAESNKIPAQWNINIENDATYIEWSDDEQFNNPGTGPITYFVSINTPGIYRFQWRNKINKGNNNSQSNDTWLKLPNNENVVFFGFKGNGTASSINSELSKKSSKIVFPDGTGLGNPANGSKDEWFKVFTGGFNWSWSTRTNDEDPFDVYVKFNQKGIYEIKVAGRDQYHAIDKLLLYHLDTHGNELTNEVLDGFTESGCLSKLAFTDNTAGDSLALRLLHERTAGAKWTSLWNLNLPIDQWAGVKLDAERRVSELSLVNRGLTGALPSETGHLSKLKKLEITGSPQLSGRFPELDKMKDLTVLDLSANALGGNITSVGSLTNLTTLKLNDNQLSGAIPADINKLTNLTVLHLANNGFNGSVPAAISSLKKLVTLNLKSNSLTGSMPSLTGFTVLKTLDLSNNELSGAFNTLGIETLTNVEVLSIANNQFTGEIPPGIVNLVKLKTLNLKNNQLAGTIPANIGSLVGLTSIDLSINQLSGPFPASFSTLTGLTVAYFNDNMLEGALPPVAGLTQLNTLALQNNKLSDLPDLSASAIANLSVGNNRLTFEDILPALGKLTSYALQDSVGEKRSVTLVAGKQLVIDLGIDKNVSSSIYRWSKNGVFYANSLTSELVVNSVTIDNLGDYTCVITNSELPELTLISRPVNVIVNEPPVFTSIPDPTATSDEAYTYIIEVTDPNADDSVSIAATTLPAWLTLTNNEDGSIALTGTPGIGGCTDNQVTLVATDKGGQEATQSFTIDISANFTVSITSSKPAICKGEAVTFEAVLSNPGESPVYQWFLNNVLLEGLNAATITTSTLKTGDVLKVKVNTQPAPCLGNTEADSDPVAIEVIEITTMSILLNAEQTELCAGEPATFTSILADPGLNPVYQWLVNGTPAEGGLSATYTTGTLADGDVLKVKVTAENPGCLLNTEAESKETTVSVKQSITLDIALNADKIEAQAGDAVTFTATTAYSASKVTYAWFVNDAVVPEQGEATFVSSTLQNNDEVKVKLTADSVACLLQPVVESQAITIKINVDIQLSEVKKTGKEGTALTFAPEDFTAAFSSGLGSIAGIKVTTLPAAGVLKYNGIAVSVGREITINNVGNLEYTPNAGFAGTDGFKWNGTEGTQYAGNDANVNITIEGVNAPPVFTLSRDTVMLKQNFNTVEEITVIPAEVRPGEANQVVTYTLTPPVSFANVDIDQGTGKVSIAAMGGRIGRQMITVAADDGQAENNTYSQTFYLEIRSSLNTSPSDIRLSSFNIPENQPTGSTVTTINVIDNDANDVHQIEFIQNDVYPDNALFTIEGNAMKNNQVLNFEEKNRMFLNLKATDKVGNSLSKQLVINIININDLPVDIGLSSVNVRENLKIGGVVGEFTTVDDDPNDVHTYTLVGQAQDHAQFVVTGSKLVLNSNMDLSAGANMQIRVRTNDGNEGFEKDFTLKVVSPENIFADIKTGFTPNGDGWNNTWQIDNIESYPDAKVEIYDSWGRRVFFSIGYVQEWDGTFEKKELPAGTYYYIIDTFVGKPVKGTVTLMR